MKGDLFIERSRETLLFLEIGIVFIAALLFGFLFASLWAHAFLGNWLAISFQNELPNILIFSSALTALIVVWRSRLSGRARLLLLAGLALIVLEVFFELPLKKYVAAYPAKQSIRDWFFLFGGTEFAGMFLSMLGLYKCMDEK